ncbi:MAG TPA: hypothetical protein VF166_08620 [Gemmatimonadaceae bacterium]
MALADHVGPALKGWLTWDDDFFLGPRYIKLLEGIERTGTIRGACPGTGMSYRTCLNRIRRMERILGEPVIVVTRGGTQRGSARLTPTAHRLIRVYRAWRDELERLSRRSFEKALRL